MKYSLEIRVPLLDYNVIEFALNLSPKLKINNDVQKYLLKQVLYDYVPEHFFERHKWGFSIPLSDWLKNELRFLLEEISCENNKLFEILNYQYVNQLKKLFLNHNKTYLYNRLWAIIILNKWIKSNL
jgi:asparagine synthase (glutamine-hydrolysing)